jgi:hypothetical protein
VVKRGYVELLIANCNPEKMLWIRPTVFGRNGDPGLHGCVKGRELAEGMGIASIALGTVKERGW